MTPAVNVKIKLENGAIMPVKGSPGASGYDIYAKKGRENIKQVRKNVYFVNTGISVEPEEGYSIDIVPNSRIGKTSFMYANSFGVIDSDYRGTIHACIRDIDGTSKEAEDYFESIASQARPVGQLLIRKKYDISFIVENELSDTERGAGGFGSTEQKN